MISLFPTFDPNIVILYSSTASHFIDLSQSTLLWSRDILPVGTVRAPVWTPGTSEIAAMNSLGPIPGLELSDLKIKAIEESEFLLFDMA